MGKTAFVFPDTSLEVRKIVCLLSLWLIDPYKKRRVFTFRVCRTFAAILTVKINPGVTLIGLVHGSIVPSLIVVS